METLPFDLDEVNDLVTLSEWIYSQPFREHARINRIKAVNSYLRFLGLPQRLKYRKVKGRKDIYVPSKDEKESLVNVVLGGNDRSYRARMLMRVLFETGMRSFEVCNMRIDDVKEKVIPVMHFYFVEFVDDTGSLSKLSISRETYRVVRMLSFAFPSIKVYEDVSYNFRLYYIDTVGKGLKERQIPVSRSLYYDLEEYYENMGKDRRIFPFSTATLRKIIGEVKNATGVYRFHAHAARHYRALELYSEGVDLRSIQEFLGHSSLFSTQQYLSKLTDEVIGDLLTKDVYLQEVITSV